MEQKPFDNKERHRYYGLRVGDTVRLSFMGGYERGQEPLAEVFDFGSF